MRSKIKTQRIQKIRSLFDEKSINHFKPRETFKLTNEKWPDDTYFPPPSRLHENILPTVEIADEIREELSSPIKVYSGFRPYLYNEMIDGAEDSMHMYYRALDITPVGEPFDEFLELAADIISRRRNEDSQIIGFGRYFDSDFIHVDTGTYSYNRDWNDQ